MPVCSVRKQEAKLRRNEDSRFGQVGTQGGRTQRAAAQSSRRAAATPSRTTIADAEMDADDAMQAIAARARTQRRGAPQTQTQLSGVHTQAQQEAAAPAAGSHVIPGTRQTTQVTTQGTMPSQMHSARAGAKPVGQKRNRAAAHMVVD